MGANHSLLDLPNDILAVEYCKAILSRKSSMAPFPIRRDGSYHAASADPENPSATSLRALMRTGRDWLPYVPEQCRGILESAPLHSLEAGSRAVLGKLRTMTDAQFEALPYGSEGLWRKFMHECRRQNTLEEILTAVKSKRYTRSRLDRMAMCAFLDISRSMLEEEIPYVRVLGFTDRGREILRQHKKSGFFRNAGEETDHPYWQLEQRCTDLYGLFREDMPEAPGMEKKRRVLYRSHPQESESQ